MRKGNQVWILSDPVTVFRECPLNESIVRYVWEGKRYMIICKSGNLLSTWGETSDESSVPNRKVFALCLFGVSAFGSRHFLFMECARCGTVQAAGKNKSWTCSLNRSDRPWRHSACSRRDSGVHSPKSLIKSDILLPNLLAYIINQPKYFIRQLWHLRQQCSDFSISLTWDYLQLPCETNERDSDNVDCRCFYLRINKNDNLCEKQGFVA